MDALYGIDQSQRSLLNMCAESTWMNYGYWARAAGEAQAEGGPPRLAFADACAALARLVGTEAGLCAEDEVLDVGCGAADQDVRARQNSQPGCWGRGWRWRWRWCWRWRWGRR